MTLQCDGVNNIGAIMNYAIINMNGTTYYYVDNYYYSIYTLFSNVGV